MFEHVIDGCQCRGKQCAGCEDTKCYGAFHIAASSKKDGRMSHCMECRAKRREQLRAKRREQFHQNKTHLNLKQEVYEILKVCKACGQEQPIEAFPLVRGKNEGYLQREPRCKECVKTRARESARIKQLQKERERIENSLALAWEARIQEKQKRRRDSALKRCYGKTLEEYNAMVRDQQGKCAICGQPVVMLGETLVVDHSHVTGTVRGLLCFACNVGLGSFRDNVESMQNAIDYLRHYHPWEEMQTEGMQVDEKGTWRGPENPYFAENRRI